VWVDKYLLPHRRLPYDARNWRVEPVVVFGVDGDRVHLADGSRRPFTVPLDDFTQARARVKQERFRVVVLGEPDMGRLPAAVRQGIRQCISLFTEPPPKGSARNFGFAAFDHWANMLAKARNKQSWARFFPPGERLFAALAGDL